MIRLILITLTFLTSFSAFAHISNPTNKIIVKNDQIQLSLGYCDQVTQHIPRCFP
ncbi:MAG: hypothetical protein K1X44_08305 [Alphaproteobacteria bacterium]|nr:hypothetical protein [Alphaproteobacteria bacterium]